MKEEFEVTGMHCQSCVDKVRKAIEKEQNIDEIEVTLSPPRATISSRGHIERNKLNRLIKAAGEYELQELNNHHQHPETKGPESPDQAGFSWKTYFPLLLIFTFIAGLSLINQINQPDFSWWETMRNFMGGFFIVFSFFKFLDLKAFAYAYQGYDIIAKKSFAYALIYPFIELALGISYFVNFNPLITNGATFFIMTIGTIGVLQSILNKRTIQCACLGTVFKLPMSKVTLFEDLLMVVMAGVMLIRLWI